MTNVSIFWDPRGFNLDTIGTTKYDRITDGDTAYVSMSIRMLSADTPETHYPRKTKPSNHDEELAQLAEWMQQGKAPIHDDLAALLRPKLVTGAAGTLQEAQGNQATDALEAMIEERLAKPNGEKRSMFVRAADEHFDQHNRLLAYLAPNYTKKERESMSAWDRMTFNLQMVLEGWAATLVIYPSLPKHSNLVMLQEAAKRALDEERGAWADPLMLTGYEFRMCVKLYKVTNKLVSGESLSTTERYSWISRYCADMTTKEIYYPQDYHKVEPYNRIFIWPEDVTEAVGSLNLVPGK